MSDKNLTELEWKKFSKGRDYKDAALVKALAALERAQAADPQLEALAEIEKQADLLRKANKTDKELTSYLSDLDKALDKQRKLSEFEAKKASAEGEEEPDLLGAKMIAPLREVAKGESALPAMVAVLGKDCAVLVSRRPIGASQKKLLTTELGGTSGVKFMPGECIWEANAHTFVLEAKVANLSKLIKAQLLKQTALRFKVRVRGADPHDVDDDGEQPEQEGGESQGTETPGVTPQQSSIPVPPPLQGDPLKAQYETRMSALEPRVLAALKGQSGDTGKIRAVAEFVRGKGDEGNYKAALQGMESLAKLLDASPGIPPAPPQTPSTPPANTQTAQPEAEAAAFNARLAALMPEVKTAIVAQGPAAQDIKLKISEAGLFARKREFAQAHSLLDQAEALLAGRGQSEGIESESEEDRKPVPSQRGAQVAFTQSRLAWDDTRKFVQAELRKLEAAILAGSVEEEDFEEIGDGCKNLYVLLDVLDERLIDKLDEALNAEGDKRKTLHGEARSIIGEYLDFVNSEPLMQDIDDSGFADLKILPTLTQRLQQMDRELGASFARY